MSDALNIVRADFEGVLPVLIFVGIVISQIVKAARGLKSGPQPRPMPPPDAAENLRRQASPEDEVRRFLESLSGQSAARPAPSAPAAPRPAQAVRPASALRTVSRPQPRPAQRPRAVAPPPAAPPPIPRKSPSSPAPSRRPSSTPPPPQTPRPATQAEALAAPAWAVSLAADRSATSSVYDTVTRESIHPILKRTTLKDAVLLREIMGPPVALRNVSLTARGY